MGVIGLFGSLESFERGSSSPGACSSEKKNKDKFKMYTYLVL